MMRATRFLMAVLVAAPAVLSAQATPVRWVTAARVADDAARDSAISKLEDFLEEYPASPLRPNALFQLGELLVLRADEQFAESQRASTPTDTSARGGAESQVRPNYAPAIARYEQLVRGYPNFDRIDAAAYTLGTLYNAEQRYVDAARMFELVTTKTDSRFRGESFFRLGDAIFEQAAKARGTQRQALFARSAAAYEQATQITPKDGDIYFLALYKLGWSYYNQATRTSQEEYQRAVEVFGQLVDAYDRLTPDQQSRLGLRGEAIEYMAIAFTQVGGAEAANRFFEKRGGVPYQQTVLRRVATSLRDQGDFTRAVEAFNAVLQEEPTDSSALSIQREIVDIYQNRMLQFDSAQAARLRLVENFGPNSAWAQANPGLVAQATAAREDALRQSGQYLLAAAQQRNDRARYAEAAAIYQRYMSEFGQSDSAQAVNMYYAAALVGQGEFARAGAEFARTAFDYPNSTNTALAQQAGRNAIVAYDSALVRNKADRATQDAFFSAVDRFAAAHQNTDLAKQALIQKGRRASETQRWEVLAETFRTYAQRYPDDAYTPTAQKLVGDALYKQGQYAEAQVQWEAAQQFATSRGRRALADSIGTLRTQAAATFADTLVRQGNYERAAEEVYVALADKNPTSPRAPGALRDAIETYILADSAARARGDTEASNRARQRAIELSNRLVSTYPNYQYRLQYQTLAARLLAETGKREEAVEALRTLISQNRNFTGRADAMVQLAVSLDSLGRKAEAAAAYEEFSTAYPKDPRAADAQFNAAVTYAEAQDNAAAARAFSTFATRFPRDPRAGEARQRRLGVLESSGDSSAVAAELTRICSARTVAEEFRDRCRSRTGDRYFRQGASLFSEYRDIPLVISTKAQLTAAGVTRASARKQQRLKAMVDVFRRAIESGDPRSVAGATYYVGLAQWEYGNFLKNVQLPEGLTEEERNLAQQGSATQAEQFYAQARETWQALIQKAEQEPELSGNAEAQQWLERARNAIQGNVDANPPTAARVRAAAVVGE